MTVLVERAQVHVTETSGDAIEDRAALVERGVHVLRVLTSEDEALYARLLERCRAVQWILEAPLR